MVADGAVYDAIRGTVVSFSGCPFDIEEATGIGFIYCNVFEVYLLQEKQGGEPFLVIGEGVYTKS